MTFNMHVCFVKAKLVNENVFNLTHCNICICLHLYLQPTVITVKIEKALKKWNRIYHFSNYNPFGPDEIKVIEVIK